MLSEDTLSRPIETQVFTRLAVCLPIPVMLPKRTITTSRNSIWFQAICKPRRLHESQDRPTMTAAAVTHVKPEYSPKRLMSIGNHLRGTFMHAQGHLAFTCIRTTDPEFQKHLNQGTAIILSSHCSPEDNFQGSDYTIWRVERTTCCMCSSKTISADAAPSVC